MNRWWIRVRKIFGGLCVVSTIIVLFPQVARAQTRGGQSWRFVINPFMGPQWPGGSLRCVDPPGGPPCAPRNNWLSLANSANDSKWSFVNTRVDVYRIHASQLSRLTTAQIQGITAMIQRLGMKTALEIGGLRNYANDCSAGIGTRTANAEMPWLDNWTANGGAIDYLAFDGPFGGNGCTTAWGLGTDPGYYIHVATEMLNSMNTVKARYPNVVYWWNDAVPWFAVDSYPPHQGLASYGDLGSALAAVQSVIGTQALDTFVADSPFNYSENYLPAGAPGTGWQKLAVVRQKAKGLGFRFGYFFNTEAVSNSQSYWQTVAAWYRLKDVIGGSAIVDDVQLEYWTYFPTATVDEKQGYTFNFVARELYYRATGAPLPAPPTSNADGPTYREINNYDHDIMNARYQPGAGYVNEGAVAVGWLGAYSADLYPIHNCEIGTDRFLSLSSSCEGQATRMLDVVWVSNGSGAYSDPSAHTPYYYRHLLRCVVRGNGEHFVSLDPACEGQIIEGPLGLVRAP